MTEPHQPPIVKKPARLRFQLGTLLLVMILAALASVVIVQQKRIRQLRNKLPKQESQTARFRSLAAAAEAANNAQADKILELRVELRKQTSLRDKLFQQLVDVTDVAHQESRK